MSLVPSQFLGTGISVAGQRERRLLVSTTHAAAAWCLFGLLALQIPLGGIYWLLSESDTAALRAAAGATSLENSVAGREKTQGPLRAQLDQVRDWERLSGARLPASAVLAAVEQTIPPELSLKGVRLAVSASDGTGDIRVPRGYLLEIAGWQQTGEQAEIGRWTTALQRLLPAGTSLQPLDFQPGSPNAFTVRLSVPAPSAEDLQRLGLRQIPIAAQ